MRAFGRIVDRHLALYDSGNLFGITGAQLLSTIIQADS
jgi:hypothetical protein